MTAGSILDFPPVAVPAAVDSLDGLFHPRSVAVIGASHHENSLGAQVFRNLLRGRFNGPVYPVNKLRPVVLGVNAYKSVLDIPGPVDLAVIVVHKSAVNLAVEECGQKGVKGAVIITAGFKEVGEAGLALETELKGLLRKHRIRAIGPNCMGLIVSDPDVRLDASFAAVEALPGNVAFLSQSGALGEAVLAQARALGLGLSALVSLGNRVDVSVNDLLEHWTDDPATDVILMYIESFGNMRKFPAIAAAAARKKPVVVVKSGRTAEGADAASSHTGSLTGRDHAADALFEKTGLLRVATSAELFSLATAFSSQPLPGGNRVAVVTNAGGPGVLATDDLVAGGMQLAQLSPENARKLRDILPHEASVRNPVDMLASASVAQYEITVKTVLGDPGVDALVIIFVSPIIIDSSAVAEAIVRSVKAADQPGKPVLTCFMGSVAYAQGTHALKENRFPVYQFPEEPALALVAMDRLRRFRERPAGLVVACAADRLAAAAALAAARERGAGGWLNQGELARLLGAYDIPMLPIKACPGEAEAAAGAAQFGYPVVLKIDSHEDIHKSSLHGVILDLQSEEQVREAWRTLNQRVRESEGEQAIVVQPYFKHGRELLAGFSTEPDFGRLIVVGMGGVHSEMIQDVAVRLAPLTDVEAAGMLDSLRSAALLTGYRGEPPADRAAVEALLHKLSQLALDFPELDRLEINPVLVRGAGQGLAALDARAKLAE
jgi:acetyl coenzyme A synthetase (ADP forming)-like protein